MQDTDWQSAQTFEDALSSEMENPLPAFKSKIKSQPRKNQVFLINKLCWYFLLYFQYLLLTLLSSIFQNKVLRKSKNTRAHTSRQPTVTQSANDESLILVKTQRDADWVCNV
ncbi:hypothetical protein J4727_04065 [Providencia rettgeri]|uniref:Uncharacterized protein n=1 Tax=Providencia rettgeri TaxID=587 RepID=A0A939NA94_PRORE|nr:hypothetical protein [Providencia rettgeri]